MMVSGSRCSFSISRRLKQSANQSCRKTSAHDKSLVMSTFPSAEKKAEACITTKSRLQRWPDHFSFNESRSLRLEQSSSENSGWGDNLHEFRSRSKVNSSSWVFPAFMPTIFSDLAEMRFVPRQAYIPPNAGRPAALDRAIHPCSVE